ncbi:hypothetical protein HUJ05_005084 [Dendroctonus ponderosae]|nr:hypothetical protein HUJ05_005084 [Dendroctonus ponderosae]
MDSIGRLHSKFIIALVEASKLFPDSFSSIVPTVLFLGPLFALLYVQFRCTSNALYGWKTKICWDVIFHWLLFYISRVWFIFLSLCKLGVKYLDAAIQVESAGVSLVHRINPQEISQKRSIGPEVYYNTLICHCCVFLLVLTVSLLPCLILYLRHYSQREIPNFLMVGEDPWIRSEIGISGHYLERPPRSDTYSPSKHNASYRSGRSSSVDTSAFLQKPSSLLRTCKSAVSVKKSNEEIVDLIALNSRISPELVCHSLNMIIPKDVGGADNCQAPPTVYSSDSDIIESKILKIQESTWPFSFQQQRPDSSTDGSYQDQVNAPHQPPWSDVPPSQHPVVRDKDLSYYY